MMEKRILAKMTQEQKDEYLKQKVRLRIILCDFNLVPFMRFSLRERP